MKEEDVAWVPVLDKEGNVIGYYQGGKLIYQGTVLSAEEYSSGTEDG